MINVRYIAIGLFLLLSVTLPPLVAAGQPEEIGFEASTATGVDATNLKLAAADTFQAKVIKILEERTIKREDGSNEVQQNLLLRGLEGEYKDREITSIGIGDFDIVSVGSYDSGDNVYVDVIESANSGRNFFVTDYVRSGSLFWLAVLFIVVVLAIGRVKGLRSLLSLILSFAVIIFLIIPLILKGFNPFAVAILGAFLVLVAIIYLTEGLNKKSHLAVASVFISLIITMLLSWLFVVWSRLSGFASEEATLLIGTAAGSIDFQGLLLAGILIGSLGVLDDIVVGQIEAVAQIKSLNPNLPAMSVFRSAYKIGNTHLGAIINTLFLTYAGVALPLLVLFYLGSDGKFIFSQAINNDAIATEIVRTLVGAIGLILSMPIATYLGSKFLK